MCSLIRVSHARAFKSVSGTARLKGRLQIHKHLLKWDIPVQASASAAAAAAATAKKIAEQSKQTAPTDRQQPTAFPQGEADAVNTDSLRAAHAVSVAGARHSAYQPTPAPAAALPNTPWNRGAWLWAPCRFHSLREVKDSLTTLFVAVCLILYVLRLPVLCSSMDCFWVLCWFHSEKRHNSFA